MLPGINSSVSALLGLNKKAASTANNVANLNTPGFKASRVSFQDVASETVATANGSSQVGRGVTVSAIRQDHNQGALATSEKSTDLAVSGQGYFLLRQPGNSEADTYSRAGDFQFDSQGRLTTTTGNYVQGWQVDGASGERQGTIGDISVPKSSAPGATQELTQVVNLDARVPNEDIPQNLYDAWDGRRVAASPSAPAIDYGRVTYQSASKIYDSQGNSHEVTVYYDRTGQENQWEFLVTTDPLADQRLLSPGQQGGSPASTRVTAATDKGAGALLYGVMDFSSAGEIQTITAYEVPADGQLDPSLDTNKITLGGQDSNYSFAVNFTGADRNQAVKLNFGATYSGQANVFKPGALASSQYANASTTISQKQDGYGAGFLQGVAVDGDGVLVGSYSNGQVEPVAQLALANVANSDGLMAQGGGMFTTTTLSGAASTGAPNSGGMGSISPSSFELANVDLGKELTDMMVTRQSFKANINMIRGYDEMLGSLLDIKT